MNEHKYWIFSAIIFTAVLIILFPKSSYDDVRMNITRDEAVDSAVNYLKNFKFYSDDIKNYKVETFVLPEQYKYDYILKELRAEKFKTAVDSGKYPISMWRVMFHQDIAKNLPQYTYNVYLDERGRALGFDRKTPDSLSLPSISHDSAKAIIVDYLHLILKDKFEGFTLTYSRESKREHRTGHQFKWEKKPDEISGKLVIETNIIGNQAGKFRYLFEPAREKLNSAYGKEALFGTLSVIFVFFLIQFAFYLFIRKYHQGEIWLSLARNIFIFFFVIKLLSIINRWPSVGGGINIGAINFTMTKLIVALSLGFLVYLVLGLLLFAAWSVGESMSRSHFPGKLKSADALIKGKLTSLSSGESLLKGMTLGIGAAVVFLLYSIVINNSGLSIYISAVSPISAFGSYFPFYDSFSDAVSISLLSGVAVTFLLVNFTFDKWGKRRLSILSGGIGVVLFNVISNNTPSIQIFPLNLALDFLFGILMAYIFFKFDFVTLLSFNFYLLLIQRSYGLVNAGTTFYQLNFILIILVFISAPVIYLISRIKREEFVLENFGAPSHIQRITERERLKKEMEIASKVQLSLLPNEKPELEGYDIAGLSIPAEEAGGDYYDFVKISGSKLGIAIGDVSGKGVGAAIYMTLTKGILQAHAEEDTSPKSVLGKVNRLLFRTIEKNSFVSMFYAILDTENNSLLFSRAGHNPAILSTSESETPRFLMSGGMALGLEEGEIFTTTLMEETISIKLGDALVFYTDGFTEAINEKMEFFGEERLTELIHNNRNKSSGELLNIILKEVNKFTNQFPQHDDMTIIIIKRTG